MNKATNRLPKSVPCMSRYTLYHARLVVSGNAKDKYVKYGILSLSVVLYILGAVFGGKRIYTTFLQMTAWHILYWIYYYHLLMACFRDPGIISRDLKADLNSNSEVQDLKFENSLGDIPKSAQKDLEAEVGKFDSQNDDNMDTYSSQEDGSQYSHGI